MDWRSPMRKYQCRSCGALDVKLSGPVSSHSPVRCARCGTSITTWKRFVEGLAAGAAERRASDATRLDGGETLAPAVPPRGRAA